ncbi:penicillin-insensitive murein endopeptidase [soil metagenome]
MRLSILAIFASLAFATPLHAQALNAPSSIGALANQAIDQIPAKKLFGAQRLPADLSPRAIGTYARGCLAGAEPIPVNGTAWQVMRLSRNRNWGHPALVALVERLAVEAKKYDGWNGLLIGDISQPRGGPMLDGHASHQIGLDADVWLTPMPDHELSRAEREKIKATVVVKDHQHMNYDVWTEAHARLIRRAASYPQVERIFVHPPIKAELCRWATGDRSWLAKVRPLYGHNYHFHIRIKCPADSPGCRPQGAPAPKDGTGCGAELAYWMSDKPWRKVETKPRDPNAPKPKPPRPITITALPTACRGVVAAQ